MRRGAFTLVEVLVVLAVLATLCGLLVPAFLAAPGRQGNRRAANDPPTSWNLYTAQHDGHWFVKDTGGGVCHHPDCPCRARTAEAQ